MTKIKITTMTTIMVSAMLFFVANCSTGADIRVLITENITTMGEDCTLVPANDWYMSTEKPERTYVLKKLVKEGWKLTAVECGKFKPSACMLFMTKDK